MQLSDKYKIERTCIKCGHIDHILVNKREAAFELVDINKVLGAGCANCSSTAFNVSYQTIDLDSEILEEWATNPELHLIPQDEELLLADERYLELVLQTLDTIQLNDYKRDLLMDALCVIVYDNSIEDNPSNNDELRQRVIRELQARKDKLILADNWIPDYIKEVVYPQLDLKS